MPEASKRLLEARTKVAQLRLQMLRPSPESLIESTTGIQAACALLSRCHGVLSSGCLSQEECGEFRQDLLAFRRDLKRLTALFHQAHRYTSFWTRLVSEEPQQAAAYDASGNPPRGFQNEQHLQRVIHG